MQVYGNHIPKMFFMIVILTVLTAFPPTLKAQDTVDFKAIVEADWDAQELFGRFLRDEFQNVVFNLEDERIDDTKSILMR